MKRSINVQVKRTLTVLLALTLLLLTGCGSQGAEEKRTVDTVRSFSQYYKNVIAAETEDTIYYISSGEKFIKYVDKATGITGVLCGKSECPHNDGNCNAYTSIYGVECLFVDSGRLYWLCPTQGNYLTMTLYSAAPDGTDRREELEFDRDLLGTRSGSYEYYIFHDDCLYYGAVPTVIENGEEIRNNYVRAFPLDPSEESFMILDEKVEMNSNLVMQFYGDSLYITTNNRTGMSEDGNYLWSFQLRRWNTESRQLETIYEDPDSSLYWTMALWVTDESAYFDRNGFTTIYRYDFETGECGPVFDHTVKALGLGIEDNIVTGFEVLNHGGGSYDFHVAIEDFEGNTLVDDTYPIQLEFDKYSDWTSQILGRDEEYAYYAMYESETDDEDKYSSHYSTIIQVALDGSGAKELCTFVEK